MIEVRDLTKRYGDITAVEHVSFTANKGEVVGFLGPNGAGKTTTMRIITGFLPATSGTVTVEGFDIFHDSHEVRKRIGYLPENPPLYQDMTVSTYLEFVGRIKGIPRAQLNDAVDRALQRCGLTEVRRRVLGHLSKGFRQRVGLAQAIVHEPRVLVLDEPTIGLDVVSKAAVRAFLREVNAERGTTVLLTTHDLGDIERLCRRVMLIDHGRLAFDGTVDELRASVPEESSIEDVVARIYLSGGVRPPMAAGGTG